jgi:hypothetical protein
MSRAVAIYVVIKYDDTILVSPDFPLKGAYQLQRVKRVVEELKMSTGQYVRFRHSWHKLHSKEEFKTLIGDAQTHKVRIVFGIRDFDPTYDEILPYVLENENSPGLYKH